MRRVKASGSEAMTGRVRAGRGPVRRASVAGLAVVATIAVMGSSCGPSETGSSTGNTPAPAEAGRTYVNETTSDAAPVSGGTLVYGIPAETSSFNPVIGSWGSYSLTIARSFYDYLSNYDEKGEVQPYLAEKFEHNADYTEWTVTLRTGITFSTGKPYNAQAAVAFQQAVKASPVLNETFSRVESWSVKDDRTFTVKTSAPWTSYPHAMATQIGVGVDPDDLNRKDVPSNFVPTGTGPFIVDRWDVNNEMVLKKNPTYWRKDEKGNRYPYLDGIRFKIIVDESGRADALRKGEIDIMMQTYSTPTVGEMLNEARSGKFQAFSDARFETPEDYVTLNNAKAPLNDPDARKALAHGLDLADYVKVVTGGLDEPADSAYKVGSPWYSEVNYPRYDLAESKRLVEVVKAKNGGQFTVTLLGNPSAESVRVQQYLQQQWAKVGIDVKLEAVAQQTKIIRMLQANYDMALTQTFDNPHPYNELIYWQDWKKPIGGISLNWARISDAQLDKVIIEAAGATGAVEKEKYAAVQKRMAEVVPYIWLAHASRTLLATPKVVNVVRATLPNGAKALEFIQGSHATYQIWLRR